MVCYARWKLNAWGGGMAEKIAEWIGCLIVAVVATLIFGSANHLPESFGFFMAMTAIAKWCGIL